MSDTGAGVGSAVGFLMLVLLVRAVRYCCAGDDDEATLRKYEQITNEANRVRAEQTARLVSAAAVLHASTARLQSVQAEVLRGQQRDIELGVVEGLPVTVHQAVVSGLDKDALPIGPPPSATVAVPPPPLVMVGNVAGTAALPPPLALQPPIKCAACGLQKPRASGSTSICADCNGLAG